jgi:ATPase subunit of ABC transporter with duplicated ATPase domains
MSSIITATDIFIRYGDRTVLDHATLGIEDGDRIGLVGAQRVKPRVLITP